MQRENAGRWDFDILADRRQRNWRAAKSIVIIGGLSLGMLWALA
jgi:hypothetical protein